MSSFVRTTAGSHRVAAAGPEVRIASLSESQRMERRTPPLCRCRHPHAQSGRPAALLRFAVDHTLMTSCFCRRRRRTRLLVTRLLANGLTDPAFVVDVAVADSHDSGDFNQPRCGWQGAWSCGSTGNEGTSILRLQASGARDNDFGDSGRTWIDFGRPLQYGANDPRHGNPEMAATAVGGDGGGFVVRLLVTQAGQARVSSASLATGPVVESEGEAIVRVRRTGGSDGSVSVAYRTVADANAAADQDFTPVSGTLNWADGDASDRTISVASFGTTDWRRSRKYSLRPGRCPGRRGARHAL